VGEPVADEYQDRFEFEIQPVLPTPTEASHPVKTLRLGVHLRNLLKGADLVHSFIAYPYLPAAAIALVGKSTHLTGTALGTYAVHPLSYPARGRLLKYGYRASSRVFCISHYTQNRIETETGETTCTLLPLGVDTQQFTPNGAWDGDYILSVGAIKRRKGQDVLLRAFSEIADEFPNLSLAVVGPIHSEKYKRELDSIVADGDFENRIRFTGVITDRDELADYYRGCKLFALTPRVVDDNFEGFGLVFLEAGACGKPSVGTRSGGVPTAVKDGETGLIAPEGSHDGLADAIRTLLTDDTRRRDYGENARQYAESLTWERYISALFSSWEEIV
jgi:phosphatidylinositol alpha-1,6-mannosyltransferase